MEFLDGIMSLPMFFFVIFACTFAGFVDSVAGGGGLISLPAYALTGIPMHIAYGCNKFSSSCGTTIATYRYWKNKMVDVPVGAVSAVGAFLSATIAAKIVLLLDDASIKTMMLVILPIAAVVTLMNKNMGMVDQSNEIPIKIRLFKGLLIGVVVGFYDGIIGPGAGTFAIIAFCLIMKYSLNTASGNAKFLNLASNYASMIVFLLDGSIMFQIAIPCAVGGIIGNTLGTSFAIKYGAKGIRKILMFVLIILFVSIAWELFTETK